MYGHKHNLKMASYLANHACSVYALHSVPACIFPLLCYHVAVSACWCHLPHPSICRLILFSAPLMPEPLATLSILLGA